MQADLRKVTPLLSTEDRKLVEGTPRLCARWSSIEGK